MLNTTVFKGVGPTWARQLLLNAASRTNPKALQNVCVLQCFTSVAFALRANCH